jgi:hypothetical protein
MADGGENNFEFTVNCLKYACTIPKLFPISAPVTQARKDLTALKKEISDMDVEIGVMEHYILKSMIQEQASFLGRK